MNKGTMNNEQNDNKMLENNETEDTPSETSDKNLKTGNFVFKFILEVDPNFLEVL